MQYDLKHRKKPLKIAVINSPFGSHIGRMGFVFKELQKRGHEVQFWGTGDTQTLATKFDIPFCSIPMQSPFDRVTQEELKPAEYYTRVFFPMAVEQVTSALALCEKEKPDLIEANTRVFAGVILSQITKIPVVTHCCSGNSFAQTPEDLYGFCTDGNESEKVKKMMRILNQKFFAETDAWYNKNVSSHFGLPRVENAIGLHSTRWSLAHTVRELSRSRIADLPQTVLTGPIIQETASTTDFSRYRPYCYLSLGTGPWNKDQIKSRYERVIESLPPELNVIIGLGNLFSKKELKNVRGNVYVFDEVPQIEAIKSSDFVICHGGCQTVHEALYFGKPIIGLPHYAELNEMIQSVENNNAGVRIPLSKISRRSMDEAIEAVRSSEAISNALRLSNQLKNASGFDNCVKLFESIEV